MRIKEIEQAILSLLSTELSDALHYHSMRHVLDVSKMAMVIADNEGISGYEKDLLYVAALFHDSGFMYQTIDHEEKGCEIVRAELPKYSYSAEEIERICGMIMATKIPQRPHNKLEQIMCDADLDYLGRDDFWQISEDLYRELKERGSVADRNAWNKIQISFLGSHHYFTETCVIWREEKKRHHLKQLIRLTEQ